MLKLTIHNNWTYFEVSNMPGYQESSIYKCIEEKTTHHYSVFYKNHFTGRSDHVTKHFCISPLLERKFPTGLLWDVLKLIVAYVPEDEILVEDYTFNTEHKLNPHWYYFPYKLDEHQLECVRLGLDKKRGFYYAATGAGKTSIMISLACELGGRSLVIVPSIDLLHQIAADFEATTKQKPVKIQGKDSLTNLDTTSNFVIAISTTLGPAIDDSRIQKWVDSFNNLFMDEIHHANITKGNKTTPTKLNAYLKIGISNNIPNRFGFTATPGLSLLFIKAITGAELYHISEDLLVKENRLSKSHIFMYKFNHLSYHNYEEAFLKGIIENPDRNNIVVEIIKGLESRGLSTLIMLDSKQKQLKDLLERIDISSVTGDSPKLIRETIFNKLHKKEILTLATTVAKEGVNIKSVDCIFRVGAIKSEKRITQEKGRGIRLDEATGKDKVLILDFYDDDKSFKVANYTRAGLEYKTKTGFLKAQSDKRVKLYKSNKSADVGIIESIEELFKEIDLIYK